MDGHPWNVGPAAREFAVRHGLSSSVRFLGSVDPVDPLLRAADVLVQPSHFEALGLSAVEALASGVPVIASAVGGLLDFMIDDDNGKLCPPNDPPALAASLRALIDDPGLRRRLATRARTSVLPEYDERCRVRALRRAPAPAGRGPGRERQIDALRRRFPFLVNSGYATITAGKRGASARPAHHRRTVPERGRLWPLLVCPGADDDHRDHHGHRPGPGDGPRGRARPGLCGSSVPARARPEARLGRDWSRAARGGGADPAPRSAGHPPVLSHGPLVGRAVVSAHGARPVAGSGSIRSRSRGRRRGSAAAPRGREARRSGPATGCSASRWRSSARAW